MYDIFFCTNNSNLFEEFKKKYITAKICANLNEAKSKTVTKFFWIVWDDIEIDSKFKFDYKIDVYNEKYVHVFKNGKYFDGICIIHKNSKITEKEFDYRFFTNKKEIDIIASYPKKYETVICKDYNDYQNAIKIIKNEFFYILWDDLEIKYNFEYQVPYYEKDLVHVFKNGKYFDGICLLSKNKQISKKEFDYRFFLNRKEVDIIASYPKPYDVCNFSSFEELIEHKEKSVLNFIICVPNDVNQYKELEYQVPYYEKDLVHVFKNGKYFDGIFVLHHATEISKKEVDYRFFLKRKEINVELSKPAQFDIVFISYYEKNAEANFNNLQSRFPSKKIQRIKNVKGIHNAHMAAAKLVNSSMFWVVDADAEILDGFKFDFQVAKWDQDAVHVWRSSNPINGLVYGYGGVKLLPKHATENMDLNTTDMTTSISSKFKLIDEVSNLTKFNVDPFSTWKSAFRECCKLASKVINRQDDVETTNRLEIWCDDNYAKKEYGKYAVQGARDGKIYGEENKNNLENLKLINNFEWLHDRFSKNTF